MLAVYSIVKSTHLYSLEGNFLIWQVSTPCRPPADHHQAGLLGPLSTVKQSLKKRSGGSLQPSYNGELVFGSVPYS